MFLFQGRVVVQSRQKLNSADRDQITLRKVDRRVARLFNEC